MIHIENLYKTYNILKENECEALRGLSLDINTGDMMAIVGKSGAGKSTLLHIIGCIDSYGSGKVIVDGKELSTLNDKKRAEFRNNTVGIVMQDFALIPEYTVYDNIMIPILFSKNKKNYKKKIDDILKQVGMIECKNKMVNQLSGGQRQRVAIARAIINNPKYILADEPTGALDSETSEQIMHLLLELNKQGITIIIITHNSDIAKMCSRIVNIKDGKIV